MVDLYDKTGREIMLNDVIKVFHFTGARRKRYYMYQQPTEVIYLGGNKAPYLKISHLNGKSEYYTKKINGGIMEHVEIVQGFGDNSLSFEDRPRNFESTELTNK
jgi:hypothetical protein